MRPEEIRKLLRRQPFIPIQLHLSDGSRYEIRHPEMAFLTRSSIEIGFEEKEGSGVADDTVYVSLLHVVKVQNVNGRRGKRTGGRT